MPTWFEKFRNHWRYLDGKDVESSDQKVVDRVSLELDSIRAIYNVLRDLRPEARIRVWKYVEALLGEEP